MDFPCSDCEYDERCFSILKVFYAGCRQGRRKKKPQTQITDFPGRDDS